MARILIIDDNGAFRSMLRRLLELHGHAVAEAGNGIEGMSAYRQHPADVVLCDIVMPDKEGLETIRELLKEFPAGKIIAMSGWVQVVGVDPLQFAERFGATRTLRKPFEPEALLQTIAEILGQSPPVG